MKSAKYFEKAGISSEKPRERVAKRAIEFSSASVGDAQVVEGDANIVSVRVVEFDHEADEIRGLTEIHC